MSYSSLPKFLVVVVSASILVGCDSGTPSGKGSFDSMSEQKQVEVKQQLTDQMTEANKKAMQEQGMENIPEGVGPKFPDPAKYKKGGQMPGQPTTPPTSGGGGTEKKGN